MDRAITGSCPDGLGLIAADPHACARPGSRIGPRRRDFTVAILRRWGMAERSPHIAMVVSELLTNALRHAPPGPVPLEYSII